MSSQRNLPSSPRILVAEDHPVCALVLKNDLAELGAFDIAVCDCGVSAWRAWLRAPAALLITDLNMPRMDGMTLARAIRAAEVRTSHRTVIAALTASFTPTQRMHCAQSGIDELLLKPLELGALEALLKRHLVGQRA
ncbi:MULTISPECIES: response regulator [Cupriavidus]|uniref:Response regulator n=1 Tax=Cupriavidus pauculus TaxID=82633 RepID=A0A5P2HEQ6_9BURK|nr:response regulator [Cupriavidus pauculus]QET06084.1 response regulator [Cupriavidus pauculus]